MDRKLITSTCWTLACFFVALLGTGCAEMPGEQPEIGAEHDGLTFFYRYSHVRIELDINDDGYDDLAALATSSAGYHRTIQIFHGSSAGLPSTPSQVLTNPSSNEFDAVRRAGDVNGDGFIDLIAGSNLANGGDGEAYLYYGSATGLSTVPDQILDGSDFGALSFGWSVAGARDINADGFADVIIGGIATPHGSTQQAGAAFVFYGSSSGLDSETPTVLRGSLAGRSFFGFDIKSAEINGDRYTDIIVSEHRAPAWGGSTNGRVFVFLGSSSGIETSPATTLSCPDGDFLGFGHSIANVGDFNNDGFGDIVVGAYGYGTNDGRAYLFAGRNDGVWSRAVFAFEPPSGTNGYFGYTVRGGDVNDDWYDDVIITETDADGLAGRVHVFHGYSWFRGIWFADLPLVDSTPNETLSGNHTGVGYFGQGLTVSDYDGDGLTDIAAGAPAVSSGVGRVYIFMGTSGGVSSPADLSIEGPNHANGGFGFTLD